MRTTRNLNPHDDAGLRAGDEHATFAAGCFWGVEALYREIEGVTRTAVGYTGGHIPSPTYGQVCGGDTGHAEAIDLWFNPTVVSYRQLVDTFWRMHDPTTRDRQGWDVGSQYRSAIFFHDAGQKAIAIASRDAEQRSAVNLIVTEIVAATEFHAAEDYHQQYFEKQGVGACAVSIG